MKTKIKCNMFSRNIFYIHVVKVPKMPLPLSMFSPMNIFFVHGTTLKKLVFWRPSWSQMKTITNYYGISPLSTINFLFTLSTLCAFNFNFVYNVEATYELAKYKMSTIQPSKVTQRFVMVWQKFIQSFTQKDKPCIRIEFNIPCQNSWA